MDYEASKQEQKRIAAIIKAQGAGAGTKWNDIALAAMGGGDESKAEIAKLIGKPVESMLDYWLVMGAAQDAMPKGERQASYDMAAQRAERPGPVDHVADKYLANRLGDLRRERGLSQQELARVSGVTLTALQKLENGANKILGAQTRTTMRIAAALGISVEELVGPISEPEAE